MRYVCLLIPIYATLTGAQGINSQEAMNVDYSKLRGQALLDGREDDFGLPKWEQRVTDAMRVPANPIIFPVKPLPARSGTVSVKALQHRVPKPARKANERGVKFAAKKEDSKATVEFEKAVVLDPAFADAHNNLGSEYYMAGRVADSAREFRRAVELNPAFAIAYTNLALAEFLLGDREQAAVDVRHGIALGDASAAAQAAVEMIAH
jgi:tetratricopeptide (TPR) repeat protein